MRIEKWKNWYQVRNNDGFVVAQFLSRGAALAAIGGVLFRMAVQQCILAMSL